MADTYDITQDLTDGSDGALGDAMPVGTDGATNVPDGSVHQNAIERNDTDTGSTPAEGDDGKNLSIRERLSNAFKGAEEGAEPKATDGGAPKADPNTATTPPPALQKDGEGRWRTADGLFASQESIDAFLQAQQGAEQGTDINALVGNMPAAQAEQFKSLPAEMQQYVARTMEDLNGRAAKYAEYDQIESIIGPRRDAWAQNGTNSIVALNQLFALSDFAGTKPDQFVLWFAEQNGIDLDALLDQQEQQGSVDPQVRELQNQVNQLTQQVAQSGTNNTNAAQQARVQVIERFASEKDGAGALKHPYLNDVLGTLPAHVQAVRLQNPTLADDAVLAQAYEAACWATPNVRQRMQTEMTQQQREKAGQRVQAARNASSSVTGGPNGGGAQNTRDVSKMTLRQQLEQNFAAAQT